MSGFQKCNGYLDTVQRRVYVSLFVGEGGGGKGRSVKNIGGPGQAAAPGLAVSPTVVSFTSFLVHTIELFRNRLVPNCQYNSKL